MASRRSLTRMAAFLGLALLQACTEEVPTRVESTFSFERHAFSFNNFGDAQSGWEMTPSLAARMFGAERVCRSGGGMGGELGCQPNATAAAWIDDVNAGLRFGHSEGMAVLSLLMSLNRVDPTAFGASAPSRLDFGNRALREELAYWAATQKVLGVHQEDQKFSAKEAIPFLAKALKDPNEGWRLLIAIREANGFRAGHAVVPFGYFKGTEPGQYFLRIYDPNFPAEERRIELNVDANTWHYQGSPNPDAPRAYEGTADNGNLLYFSPVTRRMGQLMPPFTQGFSASTSDGALLVKGDTDGTVVGFQGGQLVEEGGTVLPGASDCFCKAPSGISNVLVEGSGSKTVSIASDGGTVNVISPEVAASLDTSSGEGAVTVDPESKSVTFNSTSSGGTTITTTTKNADGSQTTVKVTVSDPTTAITVDASDPENVTVSVDATQSGTAIAVETTVTQPDGTESTAVASGTTNGNDAELSFNTQTGETAVNTAVNYATCKNEQKDPMESDIDCGGFCALQEEKHGDGLCGSAKACGSVADCVGGTECFEGLCRYPSCSDGRKNGNETQVDCGGGCYCAVGQPCDGPCRNGTCVNGVCAQTYEVTLNITGLGSGAGVRIPLQTDQNPEYAYEFVRDTAWTIRAASSFKFTNPPSSEYTCAFDNADAEGNWTGSNLTAGQSNTLRCTRRKFTVFFHHGGSACEEEVNVTPADAASNVRVWERRPRGPAVSLTSAHPAVTIRPILDAVYGGSYLRAGEVEVTGSGYDGGTAWQFSVGAASEDFASYVYVPFGMSESEKQSLGVPHRRFRQECTVTSGASGAVTSDNAHVNLACTCEDVTPPPPAPDGGTDGGTDAGTPPDGGMGCNLDSDCGAGANCYCDDNSGACNGTGTCGAAKYFVNTGTSDGVAPSGTFTVPADCSQVRVTSWGAAGGEGEWDFLPTSGGAGGYVSGTLSATAGDVFTVWVGNAGAGFTTGGYTGGIGSFFGTPANGGDGHYDSFAGGGGGGGGGLTSIRQALASGTQVNAFTLPAGGGGGLNEFGISGGDPNAVSATSTSGESAGGGSQAGGGGAGELGGAAGLFGGGGGSGGAFGTLPAGLTGTAGSIDGLPEGRLLPDYSNLCGGSAGNGNQSGGGCVVLRCVP